MGKKGVLWWRCLGFGERVSVYLEIPGICGRRNCSTFLESYGNGMHVKGYMCALSVRVYLVFDMPPKRFTLSIRFYIPISQKKVRDRSSGLHTPDIHSSLATTAI